MESGLAVAQPQPRKERTARAKPVPKKTDRRYHVRSKLRHIPQEGFKTPVPVGADPLTQPEPIQRRIRSPQTGIPASWGKR